MDIENKSKESIGVPQMLEKLNIEGSFVTADALNCQKPIAEKIRDKGAHYFLALKRNQGTLFEDAQSYFLDREKLTCFEDIHKGHGRLEVRRCWSVDDIEWLKKEHFEWKDLKSTVISKGRNTSKASLARKLLYTSPVRKQLQVNIYTILGNIGL
jgi:predicted transposase YbfD/YdcC